MNRYIVDASVAAKWFIEEEYSDAAMEILREGNSLQAPEFLLLEMDSILCKWVKRDTITAEESGEVRDALRKFSITLHPLLPILDPAYAIAVESRHSIYDCLYVSLAVLLDCRMVTADRGLIDGLKNGPFSGHVLWIEDID